MPLEVEDHAIPHFKARINGNCELRGPRHGSIFVLRQAISKNTVLLHTKGLVPFVLISTVASWYKVVDYFL